MRLWLFIMGSVKGYAFNKKQFNFSPHGGRRKNMKKLAIAGASAVLAALPVVGVFAATGSTEFTDHLSVEVNAGCTLENNDNDDGLYVDRNFSATIATGNYAVLAAGAAATDDGVITIKCNVSTGTVTVKATPANNGNLKGTTSASNIIEPGAVVSGSESGWSIKSNATNASSNPFAGSGSSAADAAYYVIAPTAETTFLTSTASASGTTFNPSYRVYVAQGQAVDTYTGSVTYVVSYAPAA